MDSTSFLFYALAFLTCGCALAMVVSQNIVRAAAWLLFALAGVSGIFFQLGANFVGATQLLVYVGGTLVLVVFGVMLTAQGPFINMRVGAGEWVISTVVGLLLYTLLVLSLLNSPHPADAQEASLDEVKSATLGLSLLGDKDATARARLTGAEPLAEDKGKAELTLRGENKIRNRTKTSYLFPFEIVSVHLLVVLIGAAYLARAKRRRGPAA
jgi:NADH-quinone oxidoreductase subunit J